MEACSEADRFLMNAAAKERLEILRTVEEFGAWRKENVGTLSLGFVPTMGGLHEGHLALVRRSLLENDLTVVSVFLNRTQFDSPADLEAYPADFEEDVAALAKLGVEAIFAPDYDAMYPDDYHYKVGESQSSAELEGEHRPGHFDGVLTVVLKLLNVVQATRAYFGEKDWQQLQLVKGMVEAFFLSTEIVACPTVRDEAGLALSSRNRRLSAQGIKIARRLNQILNTATSAEGAKRELQEAGFEVEYVADREGRRLAAVRLEGVRLIDNVQIR